MITRADAEEIAAGWARGESERRGYECAIRRSGITRWSGRI
jgi:hypothetical protein